MLMLGSFLLLAKYSRSQIGEEGESEAMRRGEVLQRGAELLEKEKERRREEGVDKTGKYRIKDSGNGESWLIGDDSKEYANAYVDYMKGCEENLIIPHKLTDESGKKKKVEVIGEYAFDNCGNSGANGITRSIVLSRYIKVIKRFGLGSMDDVTSFEIEEGSCLESIEFKGLSRMSYTNVHADATSILVLPSTVTNIAEDGLYLNNVFNTIYYCGSTHLSNSSDLEPYSRTQDQSDKIVHSQKNIWKLHTKERQQLDCRGRKDML